MKKYLMMLFVALTLGFQACNNNDDLWDAIDDLKGRVQALETQVKALNGNVEALRELYGGKTITDVVRSGDKYVITLSDGSTIELKQGSDAEAVIPVMSIDKDGFWQVSYDAGKTFQSLGVKATAADGVTPQFRIDEATGYWQVSYDAGKTFENVRDTAGNPVKAVGTGQTTDQFFEDVQVKDGMFYIKLLDGTELNIPILKDFLCVIHTPSEGVQAFAEGETKIFRVEIKGADNAIVTAPDGWTASLSAPANDEAQLTVTAPDKTTRATADNTKDVSILITSNGYATISKIQVSVSAFVPAPTVTVANSVTTDPTQSSLSFDVTAANADGWKYICLKSADTAPDAAKVLADGTVGAGSSVTVSGLEADTKYTLYVVAYKDVQNSGVQSAENTTEAAPVTVTDYYQDYLDGKDFTVGDLAVNKTVFPDVKSVKPSELTAAVLSAGGVIFVDNSDAADLSVTIAGTSLNLGDNFVLVGRYANDMQAVISAPELRCKFDAAFKNVHIAASGTYNLFTTTNASYDPTLRIEDCSIEAIQNVVYDAHNTQNFKNIYLGNSLVKMTTANKPFYSTKAKAAHTQQSIRLVNSVFYAESPMQNYIINGGDGGAAQYDLSGLTIEVTGNTFYNLYQPNIMIRAYVLKGLTVADNVGYYTGVTAKSYLTGVYDTVNFTTADISGNYLYTSPVSDMNFWSLKHTGAYTVGANEVGDGLAVPFTSAVNVQRGYFPVDRSAVTNGAGATYDTKPWVK